MHVGWPKYTTSWLCHVQFDLDRFKLDASQNAFLCVSASFWMHHFLRSFITCYQWTFTGKLKGMHISMTILTFSILFSSLIFNVNPFYVKQK